MRKHLLFVAMVLLCIAAYGAERAKSLYKISHLSPTELSVYCLNGGDPTGQKLGDLLIISCGK